MTSSLKVPRSSVPKYDIAPPMIATNAHVRQPPRGRNVPATPANAIATARASGPNIRLGIWIICRTVKRSHSGIAQSNCWIHRNSDMPTPNAIGTVAGLFAPRPLFNHARPRYAVAATKTTACHRPNRDGPVLMCGYPRWMSMGIPCTNSLRACSPQLSGWYPGQIVNQFRKFRAPSWRRSVCTRCASSTDGSQKNAEVAAPTTPAASTRANARQSGRRTNSATTHPPPMTTDNTAETPCVSMSSPTIVAVAHHQPRRHQVASLGAQPSCSATNSHAIRPRPATWGADPKT